MRSCVAIVTAELRDEFNQRAEDVGHGPNNYSVPLSPSGAEPATHYGLHAWIPDDAEPEDTEGRTISVRDEMQGHFAEVIADAGLVVIQPAD